MTPQEIADALTGRLITPVRVQKFRLLCQRMKVNEADVLALMSEEDREKVTTNG